MVMKSDDQVLESQTLLFKTNETNDEQKRTTSNCKESTAVQYLSMEFW